MSSVVMTATAIVQMVAVGKELVDLFDEGKLTEAELEQRWAANQASLEARASRWQARQAAKVNG